jgi:hypothetical protein
MTRLDRILGIIVVTIWAATMVFLISNGFWLLAFAVGLGGGYCLFRAWWAGHLARSFLALAERIDAGITLHGPDDKLLSHDGLHAIYEEWARAEVDGYVLRYRAWWVAGWPFRGFFFQPPPIPPCPCGGPRMFVESGVSRPAQFRYVCLDCGFGARNDTDMALAAAIRRIAAGSEEAWIAGRS